MIRRYYILPLRADAPDEKVEEFIDVLCAADQFIPGLRDSSAELDLHTRTVVWENTFVDEPSYSGPYMVHPFHIGSIDNYVMADSPENLTHDIFTARYSTPDATQSIRSGIRRVLLLNIESEADVATVASLASSSEGMAASSFGADDVGWVSAKGRAWTHVWEQAFTDTTQLHQHLQTREGVASSSLEGFTRLGLHLNALKIFTCPYELAPEDLQSPPEAEPDRPVDYSITARVAVEDVDRYIERLEQLYDPFMAHAGSLLLHRWCTLTDGYLDAEVHSVWQLDSLAAYSDIRAKTYADPGWNEFVRDAMPLVRGGTRRFHRPV